MLYSVKPRNDFEHCSVFVTKPDILAMMFKLNNPIRSLFSNEEASSPDWVINERVLRIWNHDLLAFALNGFLLYIIKLLTSTFDEPFYHLFIQIAQTRISALLKHIAPRFYKQTPSSTPHCLLESAVSNHIAVLLNE